MNQEDHLLDFPPVDGTPRRHHTALIDALDNSPEAAQAGPFPKRCFDVIGGVLALIVLAPVLLVLAALIKLDSRGPVLFSHDRLGLHGRRFRMYKFRTMRMGADDEKATLAHLNGSKDARLFKIPADPRVTKLGRIMRRWSLDEIPQLYNIITGEMSFVGPRPFPVEDLPLYEIHHIRRLHARPGLTGLWQVSGRSDIVDFDEVVRLDREYIDTWSMTLDMRILARTLPVVVRRHGAY